MNAGHAILGLEKLSKEISTRTHEILPAPTLTPTVITGGEKDNIVPNLITIQIDRGCFQMRPWNPVWGR